VAFASVSTKAVAEVGSTAKSSGSIPKRLATSLVANVFAASDEKNF
jgi:hypothetical protein